MFLMQPLKITDSILHTSNVPENDYPVYSNSTTYSRGDRVIIIATHRIYECVIPESTTITGISPLEPVIDTVYWIELGWTNRWRMLNDEIREKTNYSAVVEWDAPSGDPEDEPVVRKGIYVSLHPTGIINSIALFGMRVLTYNVRMYDSDDNLVYESSASTNDNSSITDWYQYFFSPISRKLEGVLLDLPSYYNSRIDVFLEEVEGEGAQLSGMFIGKADRLGCTKYGLNMGIQDFSRKERDDFGNPYLLRRDFVKRVSFDININKNMVDRVFKTLQRCRATPVVWVVVEEYKSSLVYGFYRDFSIVLPDYQIQHCQIEVEGFNEA